MNAYEFNFKGSYLGGTVIVVAGNEPAARRKAEAALLPTRYAGQTLELKSTTPIDGPTVVYYWDGDY